MALTIHKILFNHLFLNSVLLLVFICIASSNAQNPPNAPIITEPSTDGQIVNPADVHMETRPMSDPDPGDTHDCTDWEIWTISPNEMIWITSCIGGVEKVHTHLGDGKFIGSHANRRELLHATRYRLRVRHRDNTGLWSPYAERLFQTGSPAQLFALLLDDIATSPTPALLDEAGLEPILPAGAFIRLESGMKEILLNIRGEGGARNVIENPPALAHHVPVRAVISGGGSGLLVQRFRLTFTDGDGTERTIYFPSLNLAAAQQIYFWVSENGSTYFGDSPQTEPDLSRLAQGAPVPWLVAQPGYKVEIVARGFQLPVNIAFKPNAGHQPKDPFFYVTELYGTIKVVTRDGTVSDYATNLLNFNPTGVFPGSGEQGLSGIVVEPITGDVFASLLYAEPAPNGPHFPKVVRFHSNDGGLTAAAQTTVLAMPGEVQGQSHFISTLTIGPDGKLYVNMGDGFDFTTALNLNSFRGKILRLNLDGTAPSDNPFYDARDGISARDYVYAYGFRNPFGGAWRAADASLYEVENGNDRNDRLAKVVRGGNYGWNDTAASMTINAIYNWVETHAPVNIAFIQPSTFGGSGFPLEKMDHAFVTESGGTWATGPQRNGKRIVEFVLDAAGKLLSGPTTLVEYNGSGKASASALAAGPDGLYFADLYKDLDYRSPIDRGANVLRIKFIGKADFTADLNHGAAPLAVQFTDRSVVPGANGWLWSFGDGNMSTAQHPAHTYAAEGLYDVRLTVTGDNGVAVAQKNAFIIAGALPKGLRAEYYSNLDFTGRVVTRIDPTVDFDWRGGAPAPAIGADNFSVRWTGQIRPRFSETYTFYALADDGIRLWVNDELLINRWHDQAATEYSNTIDLRAGQFYDIQLEYYERGGQAVIKLEWESFSQRREIVSSSRLFPVRVNLKNLPVPESFALKQNYPNPFNPATTIEFDLPGESVVNLTIYDMLGQKVISLLQNEHYSGGEHFANWYGADHNGALASSGLYFYELTATPLNGGKSFRAAKKMLLIR
ncbi:MAG: PQQ-dependent sugar dehydrogenase [candidate division KSB1 bacterium]|nr:PQQ-dependent sugar dehydrogenase [candidate division KSB1 bacterium]MDZ7368916.1 PQQ-dependent sugar dehydrogenase [candidate division KSB1 bacterium]MDZ7406904.1 PQQ-dependent sugar dehydrogenase [candidate division KSB1 bacterium]